MARLTSIFSNSRIPFLSSAKDDPKTGRVDAPVEVVRQEEDLSFSKRLRSETSQAHRIVESTNFVKGVSRGVMDLESFANMQAGMYLVYNAMETELERHKDHPLVSSVHFPELSRRAVLEEDLRFLYGEDWESKIQSTPAREAYVERIHWLGDNDPGLLVAHSYTRYLGDLSGGQVVKKIARRSLDLDSRDGLRFFDFDEVEDCNALKREYRARLDSLPLSDIRALEVIEEAKHVFALNQHLFEEMEGSWIRTLANFIPIDFNSRLRA